MLSLAIAFNNIKSLPPTLQPIGCKVVHKLFNYIPVQMMISIPKVAFEIVLVRYYNLMQSSHNTSNIDISNMSIPAGLIDYSQ